MEHSLKEEMQNVRLVKRVNTKTRKGKKSAKIALRVIFVYKALVNQKSVLSDNLHTMEEIIAQHAVEAVII